MTTTPAFVRFAACAWIGSGALALACASPRVGLGENFSVPSGSTSSVVAVEEFELAADPETFGEVEDLSEWIGVDVAQRIVHRLRKQGIDAKVVARNESHEAGYLIRGRVVLLDDGNRALRTGIGFGAGGSNLGVEATLLSADGSTIETFAGKRRSATLPSGFQNIERCSYVLGSDIVQKLAPPLAGVAANRSSD